MSKVDVLLGLQWGDEGKGKIVDVLTNNYDIIARFQGGPNAGHTLEFDGIKHVLHTIPSGIFHKGIINLIGNGVVVDPVIFEKEINSINELGLEISELLISKKAHLILPTHKHLDAASEIAKGKKKVGSTLKGIGPTYMDKTGRNGLRIGDIESNNFEKKFNELTKKHEHLLKEYYNYSIENPQEDKKNWLKAIKVLTKLNLVDSEYFVNDMINKNEFILAEGAQGTLLDIDFGSYPYVTSSNTISAGACTGLGISPNKINKVIGIFKAYCTRVGSGPFPTELNDETGLKMQKLGHEFGSTTGRSRRCGWLDLPALKYSILINGVTDLVITKIDVLNTFETIKVCTGYKYLNKTIDYLPYDSKIDDLDPIYEEFEGWVENINNLKDYSSLPNNLKKYIDFLENELNVPIKVISIGPDRNETIYR